MTEKLRERLFAKNGELGAAPDALPDAHRVGRGRFLTMSAATFFGLATKVAFPEEATAACSVFPCDGPRCCDCCVWGPGCTCCNGLWYGSWNDACWETCADNHWWKCCDFKQYGGICICKHYMGGSC